MKLGIVALAALSFLVLVGDAADAAAPGRPAHGVATATAPVNGAVNINTADVKQLMTLTGVGRKAAEKIVEYRSTKGPFTKPEEIRRVQGIGGGLWEKNRDRIVVK